MLDKKELKTDFARPTAVLVGIITPDQPEDKAKEYLDKLENEEWLRQNVLISLWSLIPKNEIDIDIDDYFELEIIRKGWK